MSGGAEKAFITLKSVFDRITRIFVSLSPSNLSFLIMWHSNLILK